MARILLIASALAGLAGCRDDESLVEINDHLEAAYARFDAGDFDFCIALCQLILSKDPDFTAARDLAEDAAKLKERQGVDALKRAHVRDLATYLERAYDRLEARDIDGCIAFCRMILAREPNYCVAADLLESAEILRRREEYFDFLMAKVSGWKKLTSSGPKPDVPYESELEYPGLGVEKAKRPTSVGVSTMD